MPLRRWAVSCELLLEEGDSAEALQKDDLGFCVQL